MFTSTAYTQAVSRIPLLRKRAERVLDMLGYAPDSHNGSALRTVINTFPRDELFQISAEELATRAGTISYDILTGIGARVERVFHSEP